MLPLFGADAMLRDQVPLFALAAMDDFDRASRNELFQPLSSLDLDQSPRFQ